MYFLYYINLCVENEKRRIKSFCNLFHFLRVLRCLVTTKKNVFNNLKRSFIRKIFNQKSKIRLYKMFSKKYFG